MFTNKTEEFVYEVCKKSFLSLWSYANPKREDNKELCDILIVCDPDIIIFSVKEIAYSGKGSDLVAYKRWWKRAVEKSCKQIYGAERYLNEIPHVINSYGEKALPFPKEDSRRIHRISVSLGADQKIPLLSGDFGKGYVHIFDELTFPIILREMDTITDFVNYLRDKENSPPLLIDGGEEDFLAYYLMNNKQFKISADLIVVDGGLWNQYIESTDYQTRVDANKISYIWDELIELANRDILEQRSNHLNSTEDQEKMLRMMVREGRLTRRLLGQQFRYILQNRHLISSRIIKLSNDLKAYVFLIVSDKNRAYAHKELFARCLVTRGIVPDIRTAIGIALDRTNQGFRLHLACIEQENWVKEDQSHLEMLQQKYKLYVDVKPEFIDADLWVNEEDRK